MMRVCEGGVDLIVILMVLWGSNGVCGVGGGLGFFLMRTCKCVWGRFFCCCCFFGTGFFFVRAFVYLAFVVVVFIIVVVWGDINFIHGHVETVKIL
jgi:hypothetical protein